MGSLGSGLAGQLWARWAVVGSLGSGLAGQWARCPVGSLGSGLGDGLSSWLDSWLDSGLGSVLGSGLAFAGLEKQNCYGLDSPAQAAKFVNF